jgi:hypothetical protein
VLPWTTEMLASISAAKHLLNAKKPGTVAAPQQAGIKAPQPFLQSVHATSCSCRRSEDGTVSDITPGPDSGLNVRTRVRACMRLRPSLLSCQCLHCLQAQKVLQAQVWMHITASHYAASATMLQQLLQGGHSAAQHSKPLPDTDTQLLVMPTLVLVRVNNKVVSDCCCPGLPCRYMSMVEGSIWSLLTRSTSVTLRKYMCTSVLQQNCASTLVHLYSSSFV